MKTNEIITSVSRAWGCCSYSLRVYVTNQASNKDVTKVLDDLFGAENYEYYFGDLNESMYLACRRPESYE